jgi:restriction endonuclease Mrr
MVEQTTSTSASAVPTFDKLMAPALRALKAMGGSASNEEMLSKIIELEHIPQDVQAVQHTDHRQTKLNYNLAWAKTYLKKAGAIDNSSRGVWSLTKEGEALAPEEIAAVPARVRRQDVEARRARELGSQPMMMYRLRTRKGRRWSRPTGRISSSTFFERWPLTRSSVWRRDC